ncbi:ATP-binding protein [Syntrophus aciditrophicus]|nr:ATP-binding protein [Syntrophus aciditrophicus]OPY18140.1 MAG: hypothetical protein A4E74_00787 [Syntrophus sp. PtaB.Bin075]
MADENEEYLMETRFSAEHIGLKLLEKKIITEQQFEDALRRQKSRGGGLGDVLIELGYLTEERLNQLLNAFPSVPKTIEDTGLDASFLADLVLKHSLSLREFRLADMVRRVKLPLSIVDSIVETLQREKMLEVKGGDGLARATYRFSITGIGENRAAGLLEICRYVGPAPVSLSDYREKVLTQSIQRVVVNPLTLKNALSHLVINPDLLKALGPALTSGQTIFLYGPTGNGKSSIAEAIGNVLPGTIFVPYAVYVEGELITVFDPVNHVPAPSETEDGKMDHRWLQIRRPVIMTGGELTLRTLDLEFNPISKFYIAPLQMKANNGLFIIDDFGRQQIEPKMLLNRWIVPLEKRVDFLTLHTGMKFSIPFDQLVIFATNLKPMELADEAFLRRIRYKIFIDYPSKEDFEVIFRKACEMKNVAFDPKAFQFLQDIYEKLGIQRSANHPRDLLEHIIDQSRYYGQEPELTVEGVSAAWEQNFIKNF